MFEDINKFDENGLRHGPWKEYYEYGNLMFEGNYSHGHREGLCIDYFVWGTPFEEGFYKDGIKNGIYRRFFGTGPVEIECNYVNGNVHGEYKGYWGFSDSLSEISIYEHGIIVAPSKIFDYTGKLDQEILHIN